MTNLEYWKGLAICNKEGQIINDEDRTDDNEFIVVHYKYDYLGTKKKVKQIKAVNGGHTVPFDEMKTFLIELKNL